MIDGKGRSTNAVPDSCGNYDPDKSEPEGVISARSGMLYKCNNLKGDFCLVCKNRITPEGEYVNRERDKNPMRAMMRELSGIDA